MKKIGWTWLGFCPLIFFLILILTLSPAPSEGKEKEKEKEKIVRITCPSNKTAQEAHTTCRCFPEHYGATVRCIGHEGSSDEDVSQEDVNIMISLLRTVNKLGREDYLTLYRFFVEGSTLTEFDLSPFYHSKMALLCIQNNPRLSLLKNHALNKTTMGSLEVKQFALRYNAMTDDGFGDTLRYFNAKHLEDLDLQKNHFEGSLRHYPEFPNNCIARGPGTGLEFLPGLSAFTELQVIYLGRNNIPYLGGGQFQRNYKLRALVFDESKPFAIWENAFLLDFPQLELINLPFWLFFRGMNLTSKAFANTTTSGLINAARPMSLYLMANKIETLPSEYFEVFMNTRIENKLWLDQNPLICDERLQWLKEGKDTYGRDINDAKCANDHGHNVFTTNKI